MEAPGGAGEQDHEARRAQGHQDLGPAHEGKGCEETVPGDNKGSQRRARAARKEEHERRAKKKQQKEENRQRTGEGLYKPEITNTKTIAKRGKSKEFKKQKALKMV